MVILDPEIDERTVAPSLDKFLNVVRNDGGSIDKVDVWGRRRLAYEINKKTEGIYAVVDFTANASATVELDRQLSLSEAVMRTKVLRAEEGIAQVVVAGKLAARRPPARQPTRRSSLPRLRPLLQLLPPRSPPLRSRLSSRRPSPRLRPRSRLLPRPTLPPPTPLPSRPKPLLRRRQLTLPLTSPHSPPRLPLLRSLLPRSPRLRPRSPTRQATSSPWPARP
nr:30S ribosomal protein S6 [Cryobacterium sp. MLB-32]